MRGWTGEETTGSSEDALEEGRRKKKEWGEVGEEKKKASRLMCEVFFFSLSLPQTEIAQPQKVCHCSIKTAKTSK